MFSSFFMGGFECSSHLMPGRAARLDMIAATGHDRFAAADYARLTSVGMRTARDGLRWHLIERSPGRYDFSSVLPLVRAAREEGVQVVWDLCHYGWPDWLDVFKPEFVRHFAGLARAFARLLRDETDDVPFITPINEISFFAWACGDVGAFFPFGLGRGDELKAQLVRASIEGIEAIRGLRPDARIAAVDPVINVLHDPARPDEAEAALRHNRSKYEAWDMLAGRLRPELGGAEKYLDLIGVNYYVHNQWFFPGGYGMMIERTHPQYRPLWQLLGEVYERYRRPLFVAETGIEDGARPEWLRYVCREVRAALRRGTPIEGICLYPVVNHPGWADDRHCYNGLWDYPDESGGREIYEPLAQELISQQHRMEQLLSALRGPESGERAGDEPGADE